MKIYTRTGDDGSTGLFGGRRVSKDDPRVEAYGTIDELNSVLGLARSAQLTPEMDALLEQLQNDLFTLGAEIASGNNAEAKLAMPLLGDQDITRLEHSIDAAETGLPPLKAFILPGGNAGASTLHLGRTVARRAERLLVSLSKEAEVRSEVLIYMNRLSDLLFVLARRANFNDGVSDVLWTPTRRA